jgi:TPR repeat protein
MSPEQLTGDPVDRRTDIYACGVILYELLTGEPPFIGSTASIIQKVLNQEPLPPSTLNPALPRVLDEAVRRALAKRPAARFATADAFAQVIAAANARVADDDATIVRSAGSKPGGRRAWMSIAAALGVAVAAALAFVELRRPGPRAEGATAQSPSPASAPVVAAIPAPASQPPPTSPPDHAVAPVHIQSAEEIEQLAWDETRRADNAAAYAAYLKGYPDGRFSRLARIRLAALTPLPPAAHAELPRVPASAVAAPVSVATRPTETQPARKTTVAESGESRRGTDAPSPTKAADAAAASTPVAMAAAPPPLSRRAEAPEPVRRDADCAAKAEAGDLHCQFALGEAYRNGQGVGRDYALALRWYRKAADRGDPAAQFQVGMIYRAGLGVSRDVNEGARWVRKAADQGYAPAQNIVGSSHERGEGLASSMVLAADWYRKAADQGYAPGQNNLGRMYLFGRGVFKNAEKAASLFQLSAAQGDANAAYNLGFMNERGEGFPQSAERAASWYKTALARPNLNVTPTEREHAATFAATHP